MTRKRSKAVEPAVFDGTPRQWACAHPECTFRIHTHKEVCERFCCKHCETSFFNGSHRHGRLCERVEAGELPRAEPAPTPPLAPGIVMPQPLIREPFDGGITHTAPSPASSLEVPSWVGHWKNAGEDGELPYYIQRRQSDGGGCDWHYCLLCKAWADFGHLTSKRHLSRVQCPEWYLDPGETESTTTPYDATESTGNDISSAHDIGSPEMQIEAIADDAIIKEPNVVVQQPSEDEPVAGIGDRITICDEVDSELSQEYLEDLFNFLKYDRATPSSASDLCDLRPERHLQSCSSAEQCVGALSWNWNENNASYSSTSNGVAHRQFESSSGSGIGNDAPHSATTTTTEIADGWREAYVASTRNRVADRWSESCRSTWRETHTSWNSASSDTWRRREHTSVEALSNFRGDLTSEWQAKAVKVDEDQWSQAWSQLNSNPWSREWSAEPQWDPSAKRCSAREDDPWDAWPNR